MHEEKDCCVKQDLEIEISDSDSKTSKLSKMETIIRSNIVEPLWSDWQQQGNCSTLENDCGDGFQLYSRICLQGNCDGSKVKHLPCTVDCSKKSIISDNDQTYNSWSNWSECSSSCGPGTRTRNRFCRFEKDKNCRGQEVEYENCVGKSICGAAFTNWRSSPCSVTCGMGTMTETRTCVGSGTCQGPIQRTMPCNLGLCQGEMTMINSNNPKLMKKGSNLNFYSFEKWSGWSPCNNQQRVRSRKCIDQKQNLAEDDFCVSKCKQQRFNSRENSLNDPYACEATEIQECGINNNKVTKSNQNLWNWFGKYGR